MSFDGLAARAKAGVARLMDSAEAPPPPMDIGGAHLRSSIAHLSRAEASVFDARVCETILVSCRAVEDHTFELREGFVEAKRSASNAVNAAPTPEHAHPVQQAVSESANAERFLALGCRCTVVARPAASGFAAVVEFAKDWGAVPENAEEVQEAFIRLDEEKEAWLRRIAATVRE
jgi:hypothetical protein